jgi:hypothetical protein
MSKEDALKIIKLLSALESWSFSTKTDLPDYLHEALRLANALRDGTHLLSVERDVTADELVRLHEANQAMLEALGLIVASDDWPQIERIARAAIAKGEQS